MKKRVETSIEEKDYNTFDKLCAKQDISMRKKVKALILEFNKGANNAEKSFNINDHVLVRLNKKGREIFTKAGFSKEFYEQQDGNWRFQLHEIAHIFGKHMYNGSTTFPFEDAILTFE